MSDHHTTRAEHLAVYLAAVAYARRITAPLRLPERAWNEAAKDLANEAWLRLLTTRAWNPSTQPSLERHVLGIVKSVHWVRRNAARHGYERSAGREQLLLAGGGAASHEAMCLEREQRADDEARAAEQMKELRGRLAGRTLELSICDLLEDGVTKPAELARRTGRPRTEIYQATRRIREYAKSIQEGERVAKEEVT